MASRLNDDGLPMPFCPLATSVFMDRTLPILLKFLAVDKPVGLTTCVRAINGFYYADVDQVTTLLGGRVSRVALLGVLNGDGAQRWHAIFTTLPLHLKIVLFKVGVVVIWRSLWIYGFGNRVIAAFQKYCVAQEQHTRDLHSSVEQIRELIRMMRFDYPVARELLRLNLCGGFDISYHLLAAALRCWCGDADGALTHRLLVDLPGMKSRETTEALELLASAVLADPMATHVLLHGGPREFAVYIGNQTCNPRLHALVEQFLHTYGHRGIRESDLVAPRWAEDPAQVYALLVGHIIHRSVIPSPNKPRASDPRMIIDQVLCGHGLSRVLRKTLIISLVRFAQRLAAARDNSRFYLLQYAYLMRQLLLAVGAEWESAGYLKHREWVFFFEFSELETICRLSTLERYDWSAQAERIQARQKAYDQASEHKPASVLSAPEHPFAVPNNKPEVGSELAPTSTLIGRPASPGIVTGTALVVRNTLDNNWATRVNRDTILVADHGNLNWVHLFPILSGLVCENGGAYSHVAIVAREYNLPMVTAVPRLLERISDGTRLLVDGQAGTVTILSSRSTSEVDRHG